MPLTGKVLPLPLVLLALLSVCFFDWGGAGVASTLAGATGGWCGLYLASGVATLSWLLVLLPQLGQGWCCFNLAGFASVRLGFFFASTGLFFCSLASTGFSLSLRLGFLFRFDWVFSFASTGLIFFCFNWAFLLLQLGFSFASAGLFLSLQLGRASTELFFFRFDRVFFFRLYWAFFLRFNCAFSSFDLSLLRRFSSVVAFSFASTGLFLSLRLAFGRRLP